MPQSLAKVYIHVVFSTINRRPAIGDEWRDALFGVLGAARRAEQYRLSIAPHGRRGGSRPHVVSVVANIVAFGRGWQNRIPFLMVGQPEPHIDSDVSLAKRLCGILREPVECRSRPGV